MRRADTKACIIDSRLTKRVVCNKHKAHTWKSENARIPTVLQIAEKTQRHIVGTLDRGLENQPSFRYAHCARRPMHHGDFEQSPESCGPYHSPIRVLRHRHGVSNIPFSDLSATRCRKLRAFQTQDSITTKISKRVTAPRSARSLIKGKRWDIVRDLDLQRAIVDREDRVAPTSPTLPCTGHDMVPGPSRAGSDQLARLESWGLHP